MNHPHGTLGLALAKHAPSEIAMCSVGLGELLTGVYKSTRQTANFSLVQKLMQQFHCLPYDGDCADHYARLRAHLESLGQPIGPYDLQIAGIALRHGLIVVTHNISEFSRVPTLIVEDWQIP